MKSKTARWFINAGAAWLLAAGPAAAAPTGGRVSGEVVAVDAQAQHVTVQAGPEQRRFLIGPQTRFSYPGTRSITLADLRPGDAVTIEYQAEGDQPLSRSVTLLPPAEEVWP